MAVLAQAVTDYAAVLEQLEIVTAERDRARADVAALLALVAAVADDHDPKAFAWSEQQDARRSIHAALVARGLRADPIDAARAAWEAARATRAAREARKSK